MSSQSSQSSQSSNTSTAASKPTATAATAAAPSAKKPVATSSAPIQDPVKTIQTSIETITKYRTGGDGGQVRYVAHNYFIHKFVDVVYIYIYKGVEITDYFH